MSESRIWTATELAERACEMAEQYRLLIVLLMNGIEHLVDDAGPETVALLRVMFGDIRAVLQERGQWEPEWDGEEPE